MVGRRCNRKKTQPFGGVGFRGSCKITVQDRSLAHQRASRGRGSVSAALSVSAFRAARASKRLHRILQLPLQPAKADSR
jgi:hypothetical protein